MKKSYIVALVVIAAAIGIIMQTAGESSTYVTFDEAFQLASNGSSKSIHVVGELKKDPSGEIIGIQPGADRVSFSFVLVDTNGKEQLVQYNEPMPADFKRSEKVVVIGGYQNDTFVANKILLKCPSKYVDEKLNAGV
ncbi:MAG TPA: cytochrome c maturation protein CcmE [Cyclobacteriaceae bacterium]|nr:cytochrome c maturation protein CcmE [Cyclobacteriaceae bacterium]